MAATKLTKFVAIGSYGIYDTVAKNATLLNTAGGALNDADNANGNYFQSSGFDLVLVDNPTGGALTITFSSVNDPWARTSDITAYSIGAGECAAFGPFKTDGWTSCGNLFIQPAAGLHIAVVELHPQ